MGTAELVGSISSTEREFQLDAFLSERATGVRKATAQGIANKLFLFFDLCLVWASGGVAYVMTRTVSPIIRKVPPTNHLGSSPASWC